MAGFDVSTNVHSLPQVVKLLGRPQGANAMGVWVMTLSWMHSLQPYETTIPAELLRRYGGTQDHASLLVDVGLWVEVADDEYEPVKVDRAGRPIWRPAPLSAYRPAIPRDVRARVFARDGNACVECGATADLSLDHIHPWSLGGPDVVPNLRVLCRPCNSRKGAKVL
jgi:hypothetical protein